MNIEIRHSVNGSCGSWKNYNGVLYDRRVVSPGLVYGAEIWSTNKNKKRDWMRKNENAAMDARSREERYIQKRTHGRSVS